MRPTLVIAALAVTLWACAPPDPVPRSADVGVSPVPNAQTLDAGPVRSPAQYLAEPEFADADLERGELLSLACIACHTLRPGEDTMLGPNLGGIIGQAAASRPGFDYSPALAASGLTWTPPVLDAWLAAPASLVPGTSMVFAGYAASSDRRDLIAYLLRVTDAQSP